MRNFAAFILTHGRPDSVITYKVLRDSGYTGPIYLLVDDEDKTVGEYQKRFGVGRVIIFDKRAMADRIDEANNFDERRVIVHARNASFEIAQELGYTHFVQLDDDYNSFLLRDYPTGGGVPRAYLIRNLDAVFDVMVRFLNETPALTITMSQGGDHIGGFQGVLMKRKAMNSFVCATAKKFTFVGSVNEDVNTYVSAGMRGGLFFTFTGLQLNQEQTQSREGGMTGVYLESGTYVKSFYTVLFAPSAVRVAMMTTKFQRFHHLIDWNAAVPKIIPEVFQKSRAFEVDGP